MATTPQPLGDYPVGADNPEGFASRLKGALGGKKKPPMPPGKSPFQKK